MYNDVLTLIYEKTSFILVVEDGDEPSGDDETVKRLITSSIVDFRSTLRRIENVHLLIGRLV